MRNILILLLAFAIYSIAATDVFAQTGACCLESGAECTIVPEYVCDGMGGVWQGIGSTCGEFDNETGQWSGCQQEAVGACCIDGGTECTIVPEYVCDGMGGVWQGSGSTCGEFDNETGRWSGCQQGVVGACCLDGGWECSEVPQAVCDGMSGAWQGLGSECGELNPETGYAGCYEPPMGACCIDGGSECSEVPEFICNGMSADWQGPGSTCGEFDNETGRWSGCQHIPPTYDYLPGDANMTAGGWSPAVIGADVTFLVNYFRGIADPCLLDGFYASADVSGDCMVIGGDVSYLVNYFRGMSELHYCTDYQPSWPPIPGDAPDGWPNCETPELSR